MNLVRKIAVAACALFLAPSLACAQEATPASETSVFLFNTLLLLLSAVFALFAAAGFAMIEAGLGRAKNAAAACAKVIAVFAVASATTWLVGYNLIFGVEPGGFLGAFALFAPNDLDPVGAGRSSAAMFLLQAALASVAAAIVSGAVAERVKISSLMVFTVAFAGLIYPIAASWDRGGGYLEADWKFYDFAGATLVHGVGGAAALAGALVVGARRGRFQGRRATPMPPASLPIAALGAFLLWAGWFGLVAGAQLAYGSVGDAIAIGGALVNANLAASGGVVAAIVMSAMIEKRVNLALVVNGAIGGLVSISADPISPAIWQALLIGAFGGVVATAGATALERLKIDDVVGAAPVHLFCGLWGTLVVPWTNEEASIIGQLVGASMIGAFAFTMSALVWIVLKYSVGARVSAEAEQEGLDKAALGIDPEE